MSTEQTNVQTNAVAPHIPTIMPDGTQILSGPVPNGQVAAGMTQVTAKSTTQDPLVFAGIPGGMFTIYGSGFGNVGMVYVGNQQVTVTSWQHYRIKGLLPPGLDMKQNVTVVDGTQKKTVIVYKDPTASAVQPVAAAQPEAAAKK